MSADPPPPDGNPRPYHACIVGAHCPECNRDWSHRRYLNTIWGAVWLQCLCCGKERAEDQASEGAETL